jgi:hypothetical protein
MKRIIKTKFLRKLVFAVVCLLIFCVVGKIFLQNEEKETEQPDYFLHSMSLVDSIFSEIKVFPVCKESGETTYPVIYENSWGESRSYGGERSHEGCDLRGKENLRGK